MQPAERSVSILHRLLAGGCLLIPLFFIATQPVGVKNLGQSLLQGAFAAATIVLLMPVLIRGDWIQKLLAVVLLVIPVLCLVGAILMAAGYL